MLIPMPSISLISFRFSPFAEDASSYYLDLDVL
jgi:hypothetical protein